MLVFISCRPVLYVACVLHTLSGTATRLKHACVQLQEVGGGESIKLTILFYQQNVQTNNQANRILAVSIVPLWLRAGHVSCSRAV